MLRMLRVRVLGTALVLLAGLPVPAGGSAPARVPGAVLQAPLTVLVVLTPFRPPANRYRAGHRGVDLGAAVGTEVVAPAGGVVVFAGRLVDRGVVSIDHPGGLRSSFEPITATVVPGERVTAGQVIGEVDSGHPPCGQAACLHWGVRLDGDYIDPMLLLAPLRVRLLPWDG